MTRQINVLSKRPNPNKQEKDEIVRRQKFDKDSCHFQFDNERRKQKNIEREREQSRDFTISLA